MKPENSPDAFWDKRLEDLLSQLQTTRAGLSSDEARRRLSLYGPNALLQESRFTSLFGFLRLLTNPLVIILLGRVNTN